MRKTFLVTVNTPSSMSLAEEAIVHALSRHPFFTAIVVTPAPESVQPTKEGSNKE